MITVSLIDGDKELNSITYSFLNNAPDIEITGRYYFDRVFVNSLSQLRSQLVIIDMTLPCLDILSFISAVKKSKPDARICINVAWEQPDLIYKCICAGASGYVSKSDAENYFVERIRESSIGNAYMSIHVARLIKHSGAKLLKDKLSETQLMVLTMTANGFGSREIGKALNKSQTDLSGDIGVIYDLLYQEYSGN